MENIPKEILIEFQKTKKTYPKAWVGFNATLDKYSVYIIPKSWTNSLFINKVLE